MPDMSDLLYHFVRSAAKINSDDRLNAAKFTKESQIDSAPEEVAYCFGQLAYFN